MAASWLAVMGTKPCSSGSFIVLAALGGVDPVVVGERGLVVLAARLEVARPTGGGDRRRVLPG